MAKRQALIEKLWLIGAILVDLADDILDETFEILKVGAEWLVDLAGGLVTVVDWILDHISWGITYFGILFLRRVHDTRMSLIKYRRQIENGAFYFIVSGLAIAFLFSHYINYSYSYNGRTMGIVREQKDVLEVLDLASEELTQEYGLKVAIDGDSDITFKPVLSFKKEIDKPDNVLKKFTYMGDIQTKAYGFYVNGIRIGTVQSEEVGNSVVQTIINVTLKAWGGPLSTLYIGSMSIINSIRELVMCPCNGVMSGATPVTSFNYGADKPDRVVTSLKTMLVSSIVIASVFWAIMVFAPQWMFSIFTEDQALIELGSKCGRIYFLTFPLMAFQLTGQNTFVALNFPKYALFFSMLRKIILVAPLTIVLPYLFNMGAMGVFWTETLSQIIASVACFLTMYHKIWKPMRLRAEAEKKAAEAA